MSVSRTQFTGRGVLPRLWIDSSLSGYRKQLYTPASALSSANVLSGDTPTTSADSSSAFHGETFHVLALYDYEAADADQLSFRKNEILEIIKREETGWWAALRSGDNRVGWIPQTFVEPISERVVQNLRAKDDARIVSPASNLTSKSGSFVSTSDVERTGFQWMSLLEGDQAPVRLFAEPDHKGAATALLSPLVPPPEGVDGSHPELDVEVSPARDGGTQDIVAVPEEVADEPPPVPTKDRILPLNLKPTQPLNIQRYSSPSQATPSVVDTSDHARSHSDPASPVVSRQLRRRPVLIDDRPSLNRLTMVLESNCADDVDVLVGSPLVRNPATITVGSPVLGSTGTMDTPNPTLSASVSHENRAISAKHSLPTCSLHGRAQPACQGTKASCSPNRVRLIEDGNELLIAEDGSVTAGTLPTLIERLTSDTHDPVQMRNFQCAFFMTYKSFATADEVFTLLEDRFHTEPQSATSGDEADQWREKKLEPMQRRVLFILKMWFEEYGMLRDDPPIVGRLVEFLSSVTSPFITMARTMMDSLQRHLGTKPAPTPPTPGTAKRKVKRKASKSEIGRLEPTVVARQLCLHDHRLYTKLELRECLHWMNPSEVDGIPNLTAFCMARARLTGWVKSSLLGAEGLSRRAEMLEFWIRVAEACKELCNFSALSAIVSGLADPAIARSQFLWAHLPPAANQDGMALLSETALSDRLPYCAEQESVDGPCVPYIEPYLALVEHVIEHFPDSVPSPSSDLQLIYFAKREKWYGAVQEMLRHQAHPYDLAEDLQTAECVEYIVTSMAQDQHYGSLPHQTEIDIAHLKRVLESLC